MTNRDELTVSRTASQHSYPDREQLILLHLPHVRRLAETVHERVGFAIDLADPIGYGMIGLLKAVDRFDPSRGYLLKTYAEHRIRGAILDGLRRMDWLSRGARKKEREYQERRRQSEQAGFLPTSAVAARSSAPPEPTETPDLPRLPLMEMVNAGGNLEDLEKLSERAGLRDWFGGNSETPETLYQRKETQTRLAQAISRLPHRQRQVIHLYYRQELSMREIGHLLNVHESRVSQIHSAALCHMRKNLSGKKEPDRIPSKPAHSQRLASRPSKYRFTARQSSSVSTPIVSSAVSAT